MALVTPLMLGNFMSGAWQTGMCECVDSFFATEMWASCLDHWDIDWWLECGQVLARNVAWPKFFTTLGAWMSSQKLCLKWFCFFSFWHPSIKLSPTLAVCNTVEMNVRGVAWWPDNLDLFFLGPWLKYIIWTLYASSVDPAGLPTSRALSKPLGVLLT